MTTLATSILDNAAVQVALITGIITLVSIVLTAVAKRITDRPGDISVPKPSDEALEALKMREPALLALIVDLQNRVESATNKADQAEERARHAEEDAAKYREEAKRWQDEVLRLQRLVEGLIERGRGSES